MNGVMRGCGVDGEVSACGKEVVLFEGMDLKMDFLHEGMEVYPFASKG